MSGGQAKHDPGLREPSGKHVPHVAPPLRDPTMSVEEACTAVDSWGPEQQFGLHDIARVLRRALADLQARFDHRQSELLAANSAEVERRREAERTADIRASEASWWQQAGYRAREERKAFALELRRVRAKPEAS
jgi:hypothetical protein